MNRNIIQGYENIIYILGNEIIYLKLSPFLKLKYSHGFELYGDGTNPEFRLGCVRNIKFKICLAISLSEEKVSLLAYENRSTEPSCYHMGLNIFVYFGFNRVFLTSRA